MNYGEAFSDTTTFTLSSTGKTYELRVPNLDDKYKMSKIANWSEIFTQFKWDEICKIIYPLLIDKSDFLARKETFIDDEGFEKEAMVIGPILLLRAIKTIDEAQGMLKALNEASARGEPILRGAMEDLKKKSIANLTSEKSSTSLPPNMDTPPSYLESSHTASSI